MFIQFSTIFSTLFCYFILFALWSAFIFCNIFLFTAIWSYSTPLIYIYTGRTLFVDFRSFSCRRRCYSVLFGASASCRTLYICFIAIRHKCLMSHAIYCYMVLVVPPPPPLCLFVDSSRRSSSTTLYLLIIFVFAFTVKLGNTDYPALCYGICSLGRYCATLRQISWAVQSS